MRIHHAQALGLGVYGYSGDIWKVLAICHEKIVSLWNKSTFSINSRVQELIFKHNSLWSSASLHNHAKHAQLVNQCKMATSMFKILEGFYLAWVPTSQNLKSAFLLVNLNFELELMDISNIHSQSGFAHSFDFYWLSNFVKGISLLCKASL